MKDKHSSSAAGLDPSIFLLSAVLHCVSMTALVYLRSSFGFGFLRPKSVFFAFSWAFLLYAIYAWTEASVWREHRTAILFGGGAVVLYWVHLLVAFVREWQERGQHERYSGMPHAVWLIRKVGKIPSTTFENNWRLWGEPASVAACALVAWLVSDEPRFAFWLLILACCLWSKEVFNQWFLIRQRKRQTDNFTDAEEAVASSATMSGSIEPPQATRKTRVKRARNL